MATVQTLLSIQDWLYEQLTDLANELHISESELFALAIEEYLQRYHSRQLRQSIDEAYADDLDASERTMLEGMRRHQRRLMEYES